MSTSVHRLLAATVGVLMVVALMGNAAPAAAATHPPKVVIVVGPVGGLTDRYRAIGKSAAEEAARWTSDVVTVASPNATWPAVKKALKGASIVVYLGHGNGFPSPYRSDPYPRTQNGLGLNPVAGVDDVAHQYFGESFLAKDVRLAPGAVVLLGRLCYASGNPEPGGPEPTVGVAFQRADNYAAGWLAAGARAVVADAFGSPAQYVRRLFGSSVAIDRLWLTADTYHGHVLSTPSSRSSGYAVLLDPTTLDSGFYRSLVWRSSGRLPGRPVADQITETVVGPVPPAVPTLTTLGATVGLPGLKPVRPGGLVTRQDATLTLPVTLPRGAKLPARIRLGVRWQPLDRPTATVPIVTAPVPTVPAANTPSATAPAAAQPSAATPAAASPTAAAPAANPQGDLGSVPPSTLPPTGSVVVEPPPIEVVAEEQAGTVITARAKVDKHSTISATIVLPSVPGRYRLTTTVHGADDVAFDAATQALIAPLIVEVSGPLSVAYGVTDALSVVADADFALPVRLANSGSLPWAEPAVTIDPETGLRRSHSGPILAVRWVSLDGDSEATRVTALAPRLDPGQQGITTLVLTSPKAAGHYLLLIDLVSPTDGSLAAAGGRMAEVRVTVGSDVVAPAPASRDHPALD